MYVVPAVPEREPKVYLYSHGWDYDSDTVYPCVREFEDVYALCQELPLDFIEKNVGRQYEEPIKIVTKRASGFTYDRETRKCYYKYPEEYYIYSACYIIRTDTGEKLTAEELRPVYWRLRQQRSRRYRWPRWGRKAERCYGSWRHPRTNQERKAAYQNKDEGEPPIRPRRNRKNLIGAWDDQNAHCDANWKTQSKRKKQYRPV